MTETKVNSSLLSKFKKTRVNCVQKLPDLTGLTLGEFHADARLDIFPGKLISIFARDWGVSPDRSFFSNTTAWRMP